MNKFIPQKYYIARDGNTVSCRMNPNALIANNRIMKDIERDHRRMLFEISKRGDVYVFFKDEKIHLTREQFQQICGLWRNLAIWE